MKTIQNDILKTRSVSFYIRCAILFFLLTIVIGCNKSQFISDQSPGRVVVSLNSVAFDRDESRSNHATGYLSKPDASEPVVQRNTVALGGGLLMVSELIPSEEDNSNAIETPKYTSGVHKAAIEHSDLAANIRYRVVVFDANENYVAERDYTRGAEDNTPELLLDGGSTYTFVVYSLSSTSIPLPDILPATGRTLSNSSITITENEGFMYFRQSMTISGSRLNRLDINLKHRFSRITTVINAELAGYDITSITSNFTPHAATTVAKLSDGSFTGTASAAGKAVSFPTLNSRVITSLPTNVTNASGNIDGDFNITSITIGPLTQNTTIRPFDKLTIEPGVRYTLRIKITPDDEMFIHEGRPAARINGVIWALHNQGVDPNLPPNPTTITIAYHGNFFQFGRILPVASGNSTRVNANWTPINPAPANAWNLSGVLAEAPIKNTTFDPCPNGYRVPTSAERDQLIAGVTADNSGTFANNSFTAAKVLTSKRNSSVKMTLPVQGWFNTNGRTADPISQRGLQSWYWIGDVNPMMGVKLLAVHQYTFTGSGRQSGDVDNTLVSHNIRCVGYLTN